LRLLFLPINQNLDYDYPVYHSFFEPNVFLSFMFLLFVFGLGVYLFYCSKTKQQTPDTQAEAPYQVRGRLCGYAERLTPHVLRLTPYLLRLTAFGLFWFFITLSIESSIIPLKDVIFEHRLYLPSIGLIIAFVSVAFYFIPYLSSLIFQPSTFNPQPSSSPSHHSSRLSLTTCYLLLTTAVIVFSIAAYERNTIWKSDISLWEDVVRKSPNKEGGYLNLGLAYLSQGLTDKAIKCFLFASQLKPEFPDSYINLGLSYYTQGAFAKAIEYYQTALRLNPESPHIIHNNIGTAYDSMGLISNSIEHYEIALKLNPDFAEPYINLGIIYHSQGLIDKAIESYQIALKLNPDSSEAHYNMGISYSLKGLTDNAIKHLENSLTLKPDFAKAHYYLGVEYRKKGLIDKAEEHFRIADKLGYTN
ncbi:MAG: tetratricopeptide repeat protein, partial [Nitrospirae bacterium]|nr:tetratricopeptide repeat protein [Nitrospirota bacterium]